MRTIKCVFQRKENDFMLLNNSEKKNINIIDCKRITTNIADCRQITGNIADCK